MFIVSYNSFYITYVFPTNENNNRRLRELSAIQLKCCSQILSKYEDTNDRIGSRVSEVVLRQDLHPVRASRGSMVSYVS